MKLNVSFVYYIALITVIVDQETDYRRGKIYEIFIRVNFNIEYGSLEFLKKEIISLSLSAIGKRVFLMRTYLAVTRYITHRLAQFRLTSRSHARCDFGRK